MNFNQLHIVYLLGIGGIGMSSLARFFNHSGIIVYGYDLTPTPLTLSLELEGITIHYEENIELIPSKIFEFNISSLVIYTPAIPNTNKEFLFLKSKGITMHKRAEILGEICKNYHCLAVAGTHGKTTTSTLLATLLNEGGQKTIAFLGGINKQYNSNFVSEKNPNDNTYVVVEADEYDRSFLQLSPNEVIITSCDPDHLDIYSDKQDMINSFQEFTKKISPDGFLLLNEKTTHLWKENAGHRKTQSYGFKTTNDVIIYDVQMKETHSKFMLSWHKKNYGSFEVNMVGRHNIANACAAIILAIRRGITEERINNSLLHFSGIKRRAEILINNSNILFIDDYAHHPTEIQSIIKTVKEMRPNHKLSIIFQPHLYSRTKDFAEDFGSVLNQADYIYLLDIYPARELPISGVSSQLIGQYILTEKVKYVNKKEVIGLIKESQPEILLTLGAGDIDQLVTPLNEMLIEESNKIPYYNENKNF